MGCSTSGFLSITNSQSLHKLMSIASVMPSNHLILCHPFLLLPSIFPSIRVFSKETVLHIRWPKYWSFSYRINTSSEYSGWFPLGLTGLISLQSKGLSRVSPTPQFKSINAVALSLLYGPTLTSIHDYWKAIAFTIRIFVSKGVSLFFNILSRFVTAFLPRSSISI